MAQPENHATALGGQGGVLGVPDKLLSPPPFARPSLEKKKIKNILELQDNGHITAVLIKTHLTDKWDQVDGLVVVAGTPSVQMLNQTLLCNASSRHRKG